MKNKLYYSLFFLLIGSLSFADVKGQFKAGKLVITPKHAGAYIVRDQFNPRNQQVELLLSEGQADIKAAAETIVPHNHIINQDAVRSGNYILLWIDANGDVSMNATESANMSQFLLTSKDGLKAELKTNTLDRVAGRVYTAQPVKMRDGGTYEIDVTFDTPVTRVAGGSKLPPGGGDPGKALTGLYAAMGKKDWKAMTAFLTPEMVTDFNKDYNTPEENLKSALDMLYAWLPKKNLKVLGGELQGSTAVLEVEGAMFESTNGIYFAKMIKTDSGWKFEEASIVGMLGKD